MFVGFVGPVKANQIPGKQQQHCLRLILPSPATERPSAVADVAEETCFLCSESVAGDECRELPCRAVAHVECLQDWWKRSRVRSAASGRSAKCGSTVRLLQMCPETFRPLGGRPEDHGIKVSKGGLICIWIRTARFPIVEKAQQWSTVALIRGNTHNKMVDAFNLFG